jgi:cation diffusion facilitator family transporter
VVNQWLGGDKRQIGMLLKMICKFKDLRHPARQAMAGSAFPKRPRVSITTNNRTLAIAAASLLVAVIVLGLKVLAWYVTGSIALYSDALESIVNVVTSVVALITVRLAQKPADAALPYGYHKAEYFSAVIVGVMIIVAAMLIVREAIDGFLAPSLPDAPLQGLAISGVATVINVVWAVVLIRHARAVRSPALEADGQHLATDVVSTLGVLAGLLLVYATGWAILDPILAALVALNVLWSGWGVIRHSVGGLMDVAVPPETQKTIRDVIATSADGAIEAHDIRTRQAGKMTFIDFHLVVPGTMSVDAAHTICDQIEAQLRNAVSNVQITIHVEPEAKAKHSGIVVL